MDDGYADRAAELLGDHRPWGDFRGGKYSNFQAGTTVPFIVYWPGTVEAGESSALFSQIDLYASLAKLVGQEIAEGAAPDSQNNLNALLGLDKKGRDYVVEASSVLSVYDGTWHYIIPSYGSAYNKLTNTELGNDPNDQLYNLKEDIGEKNNVAEQYPDKVKELKAIIEKEKANGYGLGKR